MKSYLDFPTPTKRQLKIQDVECFLYYICIIIEGRKRQMHIIVVFICYNEVPEQHVYTFSDILMSSFYTPVVHYRMIIMHSKPNVIKYLICGKYLIYVVY